MVETKEKKEKQTLALCQELLFKFSHCCFSKSNISGASVMSQVSIT